MKIAYCPKCGKAGLSYLDPTGKLPPGKLLVDNRWCPRCKVYVDALYRDAKHKI